MDCLQETLVVFFREHNDAASALSRYEEGIPVITNLVHKLSQVSPKLAV
jgi:hypothetical protein